MDGITHHLDMCESCFQVALSALKEHRRSIVMFDDEQDLPASRISSIVSSSLSTESILSRSARLWSSARSEDSNKLRIAALCEFRKFMIGFSAEI